MTIPPELAEPPEEPQVDPPLVPEVNDLPFHQIPWPEFEKLCLRLAEREGGVEHAQRFGVPGNDQEGIDIFGRTDDGEYTAYQCRRVATLSPAELSAAVKDFTEGNWAERASRFVFCTSHSAVQRRLADEIVELTETLARREQPVSFAVWDAEVLSGKLKQHPDLVRAFFGAVWLEAFLPDEDSGRSRRQARRSRGNGQTRREHSQRKRPRLHL